MMCSDCAALRACRRAMGEFWSARSRSGAGCDNPFTAEQARALDPTEESDAPAQDKSAPPPDLFVERENAESAFAPRPWIVQHLRREYETMAKTEADAINKVRFRLYGLRPRQTLAPFAAHVKRLGDIPRAAAIERLRRMTS